MTSQDFPVSMRLSGSVSVTVGGETAVIRSRRERAVLARLAAAGGHIVSSDRLIDDLWHGEPPPKALAGLQVHISNLRRVLEPGRAPRTPAQILVSDAPGYALRLPREAVDLWRFEDLVGCPESDVGIRHTRLTEALELWQGVPFGPHAEDDWARGEVARLSELRLAATEAIASTALELGRDAEALAALSGLLEVHPDREELFRLTALAQYRLGRQAQALQTLRTLREYLADELGVDPSPPLRELESAILHHDSRIQRAPASVTAPAPVATTPRRVDPAPRRTGPEAARRAELGKVEVHAASTLQSGARLVWITAEAGGGKSTLAQHVIRRLGEEGWTTAIGHCPEVEGAPTAWAWREVLTGLGAEIDTDDPFRIARKVLDACASAPTDGVGTVLVLDDVHRADSATLQILRQLTTWLADVPVLIVATYRPSEAGGELLASGAALLSVTADHLALSGLTDAGIRAVAGEAGLRPVDDETMALLRSRTDGNPLFVRELARLIASRGRGDARTGVPRGVREVLLRRIEQLPPATVAVLEMLSVSGRTADTDALVCLCTVSLGSENAVLDALDTAVVAGLLAVESDDVRFSHILMRDVVYDAIPTLRRRRMHWQVFRQLETRAPTEELAVHAALGATGATVAEALPIVEAAARQRFSTALAADSVELWQRTVDLHLLAGHDAASAPIGDRTALVEARCNLVTALAHRGDVALARENQRDAILLAESLGDRAIMVQALTCWRTPWIWGTQTKGVLDTEIASALDRTLADATGAERVALLVAAVLEYESADERLAAEYGREALRLARDLDDLELRCAAFNARVFTAVGPDDRAEFTVIAEEFLDTARAAKSLAYQAAAHFFLFMLRLAQTDLPDAIERMRLAMSTATSGRLGQLAIVLMSFSAVLEVLRGNLDAAEIIYAALTAQLVGAGIPAGADFHVLSGVCLGWHRGSIAPIADDLAAIYARAPRTVAWTQVIALLDTGRVDEARALAESDPPISRDYYWTGNQAFHARALIRLGMVEEARQLYDELLPWSGSIAGLDAASVAFDPMDLLLADLAELVGESEQAARHRELAREVSAKVARDLAGIG